MTWLISNIQPSFEYNFTTQSRVIKYSEIWQMTLKESTPKLKWRAIASMKTGKFERRNHPDKQ